MSKILNYLWLNPGTGAGESRPSGKCKATLPNAYYESIYSTKELNPEAEINLWLHPEHYEQALTDTLLYKAGAEARNLSTVHEFRNIPLFQEKDESPYGIINLESLFWRQVDLLKVILLKYSVDQASQVFFSDLDICNIRLDEPEIQQGLRKHGLKIGANTHGFNVKAWPKQLPLSFENQWFAFANEPNSRRILGNLYSFTFNDTTGANPEVGPSNGYEAVRNTIELEEVKKPNVDLFHREIAYLPTYVSGTQIGNNKYMFGEI